MKKYLITSPELYAKLDENIRKYKPEYVLFRDKENAHYEDEAKNFIHLCSKFKGVKSFLHQDISLAKELNASGVHLTSTQFDEITIAKEAGLEVLVSTHTHEEVLLAQKKGADGVTYSPIFASPDKGEPKGTEDLKELLEKSSINIFALGGIINMEQVKMIEEVNPYGFASIRYFT